jgi:hypothetical protein
MTDLTIELTGKAKDDYIKERFPADNGAEAPAFSSVKEVAQMVQRYMTYGERNNGDRFVKTKDNTPEWVTEIIREAHDECLPNDFHYDMIDTAIDIIADSQDEDDAESRMNEANLGSALHWLNGAPYAVHYCDEAMNEHGANVFQTLDGIIDAGQRKMFYEVFDAVKSGLADKV